MTWLDLSTNAAEAADALALTHPRSAASRAYYSAYCRLCHHIGGKGKFPRGWNNPTHDQIIKFAGQAKGLNPQDRRRLVSAVKNLRRLRVDADYRPAATVDSTAAKAGIRWMTTIQDTIDAVS